MNFEYFYIYKNKKYILIIKILKNDHIKSCHDSVTKDVQIKKYVYIIINSLTFDLIPG